MNELLISFAIIFSFFLIAFGLINIRHIFTGNEFRGTCATNNPMIKNNLGECGVCGKKPEEECKMPQEK
ncbi:MAG: hypothetical protein KJO50_00605 [Bacteroidia bacterium]|nr:hypothetical protein [Bacteroidia bacterium]MBT8228726.1 hypothetical protein [Bacteroidia bacterium]